MNKSSTSYLYSNSSYPQTRYCDGELRYGSSGGAEAMRVAVAGGAPPRFAVGDVIGFDLDLQARAAPLPIAPSLPALRPVLAGNPPASNARNNIDSPLLTLPALSVFRRWA